jgi:hypothetical protein
MPTRAYPFKYESNNLWKYADPPLRLLRAHRNAASSKQAGTTMLLAQF